jgi:hypothetical protein
MSFTPSRLVTPLDAIRDQMICCWQPNSGQLVSRATRFQFAQWMQSSLATVCIEARAESRQPPAPWMEDQTYERRICE